MTHRSMTKLIKLSNALLTQTKQGRLTWTPTEKLDVFETNFPDYSIRIAHRYVRLLPPTFQHDPAEQTGETINDSYEVEIYNNKGRVIESADSDEMKDEGGPEAENIAEVLEELYELARGQALNTDNALDELLSRLSSAA